MKKILVIFLALAMFLTACGGDDSKKDTKEEKDVVEEEKEEEKDDDLKVTTGDVSNDNELFSGIVYIDGEEYKIPNGMKDFMADNLTLDEKDAAAVVPTGYVVPSIKLYTENDFKIIVSAYNVSGAELPTDELTVEAVYLNLPYHEEADVELVFPKNLTPDSTPDEFKEAYGEPTKVWTRDGHQSKC